MALTEHRVIPKKFWALYWGCREKSGAKEEPLSRIAGVAVRGRMLSPGPSQPLTSQPFLSCAVPWETLHPEIAAC